MALNPNHTFEDIGEVKCSIVEKNCTPARTDFLKKLLEHNGFTVIVAKSPPPKAAAKPVAKPAAAADGEAPATPPPVDEPAPPPPPDTYTVGVTNLSFSPANAVFNRNLVAFDGSVVSAGFWKQEESTSKPDEWYWKK
jgi:hypothetical protein